MATLHDLYEKRDALRVLADDAAAEVQMAAAEIATAEGEPLRAEWHRLEAEALRSHRYSPETREAAYRAWVVYMADAHLRSGKTPEGYCAAEIEQAMEEMRDAALLADRPSHSTVPPEEA